MLSSPLLQTNFALLLSLCFHLLFLFYSHYLYLKKWTLASLIFNFWHSVSIWLPFLVTLEIKPFKSQVKPFGPGAGLLQPVEKRNQSIPLTLKYWTVSRDDPCYSSYYLIFMECLFCARHCATLHLLSNFVHTMIHEIGTIIILSKRENWGSMKLDNFPQITQLELADLDLNRDLSDCRANMKTTL